MEQDEFQNLKIASAHQIFIFPYGEQWMMEEFTSHAQQPAHDVYFPSVFPTPYMMDTPVEFVQANYQRRFPSALVEFFTSYNEWQNSSVR